MVNGDGYQNCKNPEMVPILITVDDVFYSKESYFPSLRFECDERTHLAVTLQPKMKNNNETIYVEQGASCEVIISPNVCSSNITMRDTTNGEPIILKGYSRNIYEYYLDKNFIRNSH